MGRDEERFQEELSELGKSLSKSLSDERLYDGLCEILDTESAAALTVWDGRETDINALMIARGKRHAYSKIKFILHSLRNRDNET